MLPYYWFDGVSVNYRRIAVTGSRGWGDETVLPRDQARAEVQLLYSTLDGFLADILVRYETARTDPTQMVVIHGAAARGADKLVSDWMKTPLPTVGLSAGLLAVTEYPADWSLGRSAGYQRNAFMAKTLDPTSDDACIAFWDGQSKGTKHMIDCCRKAGVMTYIVGRATETESYDQIARALNSLDDELGA
jgi:hypothetical protein